MNFPFKASDTSGNYSKYILAQSLLGNEQLKDYKTLRETAPSEVS